MRKLKCEKCGGSTTVGIRHLLESDCIKYLAKQNQKLARRVKQLESGRSPTSLRKIGRSDYDPEWEDLL